MSFYLILLDVFLIRLSKEITDVEVNIPNVVKFREGQTKVNDVKKVYLTGQYRQKYKNISESNYTNSPIKSAQYRIYPTLEIGGRKIRSAYPNVRIKNADREPYKHIYTPSIFIPERLNNEQMMSTNNSPRKALTIQNLNSSTNNSPRKALSIQNRNNNNINNSFMSPLKSPTKNSNVLKMNNEASDSSYRYTHRTE